MQRAIGRYELLEERKPGCDSNSYRAVDPVTAREVEVRMLGDERCADGQFRNRLLTAARAAARLSHPNIVSVFDVGEFNERPYIATELLHRPTLADVLQAGRALPMREMIAVAAEVADALDHAHRHEVIHCELAPRNVVLADGTHRAKLQNFCIGEVSRNNIAPDTVVHGDTNPLQFLSPEHVVQRTLDGRSDLFSLGSLLYRALGGESPFSARTSTDLFMRILKQDPPPLEHRRPDLPHSLGEIVHRLLQKDPAQRFQTGAEVAQALRDILRTLPENDATVAMPIITTPPVSSAAVPAPAVSPQAETLNIVPSPEPPPTDPTPTETLTQAPAPTAPGNVAAMPETIVRAVAGGSRPSPEPVPVEAAATGPRRARGRILAILILLIAGAAAFWFLTRAQDATLNQVNAEYGRTLGHTVGTEVAELVLLEDWVAIASLIEAIGETAGMTYLTVADRDGIVRGSTVPGSEGRAYERPWQAEPLAEDDRGRVFQHVLPSGQRVLDLEIPITFQDKAVGRVFLGVSQAPERTLTRTTLTVIVALMLVGALCILFAAWRSARS